MVRPDVPTLWSPRTLSSGALPLAVLSLVAAPVAAQTAAPTKAAAASKAFELTSIPGPTPSATAAPAVPEPTPAPEPSADPGAATAAAAPAPVLPDPTTSLDTAIAAPPGAGSPLRAVYTLDTPIAILIADPGAKAVLDRDLPGISDDENIDKFKALSLRSFQPMTGGQLTDAMLATVAGDLNRLAGGDGSAAAAAPVRVGNAKRRKDDSR